MEESVHRDRLSELPQSLIHHILSFLPLNDVVSTTILSKRWVNLWTTVPCLIIEHEDDYGDGMEDEDEDVIRTNAERHKNFVNRALLLWKGGKILKFSVDFESNSVPDVNVWMHFAVNNKVEELEINTYVVKHHFAPQCLYSCSSLRKLSLVGFDVQMHESPSWNQLHSLKMEMEVFSGFEDVLNRILLGSPVLEVFDLNIVNNHENLNFTSTSLKKLKIRNSSDFRKDNTIGICCPSLETLEIIGLFGKYLFTDISSLIDATLNFYYYERVSPPLKELLGEPLKQCFSAFQHVEKVALSDLTIQVFGASRKKYSHSPLPNVKILTIGLLHTQLGEMMDLLRIFPNLKMLVIRHQCGMKPLDSNLVNYMEFESNFLLELKTVEISSSFCDFSVLGFVEILLKYAVKLEKMVLRSKGFTPYQEKKFFKISKKLRSMPRSSPIAKVILKNN